jgi:hypothetical protein
MPTAFMRPGSNTSGAGLPTRPHRLRHSVIVLATTCSGWRVIAVAPCQWRPSMVWAEALAAGSNRAPAPKTPYDKSRRRGR